MNKFSFELSTVISKVLVAEHVFVCRGMYRITIENIESLKNLTQQTNPHSKSTTETLKQDVKSVKGWQ